MGQSASDFTSLPTSQGALSRLVVAHMAGSGVSPLPLLEKAGLEPHFLEDRDERLAVRSQMAFLDGAAQALHDDQLGLTIASDFDPRALGILYYVMSSSQTLDEALQRSARYSSITNEFLVIDYRRTDLITVRMSYAGVPRHLDRHQIEFSILAGIRICRILTGRPLMAKSVSFAHQRSGDVTAMSRFAGAPIDFGQEADEFTLAADAGGLPLVNGDGYLSEILVKVCDTALAERPSNVSPLRVRIENVIAGMLPHGRALVQDVARNVGMSERTLARRLADEGLTFVEVLQQLRRDLALKYLEDRRLHISQIAWLLGFQDVSAFTHAFKRWTGTAPTKMRRSD